MVPSDLEEKVNAAVVHSDRSTRGTGPMKRDAELCFTGLSVTTLSYRCQLTSMQTESSPFIPSRCEQTYSIYPRLVQGIDKAVATPVRFKYRTNVDCPWLVETLMVTATRNFGYGNLSGVPAARWLIRSGGRVRVTDT